MSGPGPLIHPGWLTPRPRRHRMADVGAGPCPGCGRAPSPEMRVPGRAACRRCQADANYRARYDRARLRPYHRRHAVTAEAVAEMRRRRAAGQSLREIALALGYAISTVHAHVNGA